MVGMPDRFIPLSWKWKGPFGVVMPGYAWPGGRVIVAGIAAGVTGPWCEDAKLESKEVENRTSPDAGDMWIPSPIGAAECERWIGVSGKPHAADAGGRWYPWNGGCITMDMRWLSIVIHGSVI